MPADPHGHLPRLPDAAYVGRVFVHWSMTIHDRAADWLTAEFHLRFRAILTRNAERYRVVVPAYCLMPDHFHVLSAGVTNTSAHVLWSRSTRRRSNEVLAPRRLQKQAHDRVLRPSESGREAFASLVSYICQNPVRAGLVSRPEEWPFIGSVVPDLPELDPRHDEFSEEWWRYWNALSE